MVQQIRKVTVVGLGTLGAQIAAQASLSGLQVTGYDPVKGALKRAENCLGNADPAQVNNPRVDVAAWPEAFSGVKIAENLAAAVAEAELVIEAVPENLDLKLKVWRELDKVCPPEAILATNSSSLPVSRLEGATGRPEKCLNIHVYLLSAGHAMADVMGGTRTLPGVIEAGIEFVRSIGLAPLTVRKEIMGFCYNRVWRAIKRESLFLWAEAFVDFRDIDRAYMISNSADKGPFALMDMVGLDTVWNIEMVYYQESGDPKDRPPQALKDKIDRGELGAKTGKGFYTYPDPQYQRDDFLYG